MKSPPIMNVLQDDPCYRLIFYTEADGWGQLEVMKRSSITEEWINRIIRLSPDNVGRLTQVLIEDGARK